MRILFMGSGEIALPVLQWLVDSTHNLVGVVTQPDKPVGRHQVLTASAIKQTASAADVPIFQPIKLRESSAIEALADLAPDFIIVMAYGQILPKALLDLPKVACLNLHASILPRHRGASPIQSALLAGDVTTGITLMHMDVGLDTGDIVFWREIPISPVETAGSLHDRLAELGPQVLQEGLHLFAERSASRIPQDAGRVTISGKLDRESGLLDWTQPADFLERQVRAMDPWPGAFTVLPGGRKLKIHKSAISLPTGKPGEILQAQPSAFIIAAGQNSLQLLDIQLEGRSRMKASDFLRGNPLRAGDLLPFRA